MITLQHLIFAASYVRVAVIFKLVFSIDPAAVMKSIKRRKTLVNIFTAVVFCLTALPVPILTIVNKKYLLSMFFNNLCIFIQVVALIYALVRIRGLSKMLKQNRIFANELLMISHLAAYVLYFLSNAGYQSCFYTYFFTDPPQMTYLKLLYATLVL